MSMKMTVVEEARVKIVVQKTGKTYRRSVKYAKREITGAIGTTRETRYYLRDGRGWKAVDEEQYRLATSKENIRKLHKSLSDEIGKRVEAELRG